MTINHVVSPLLRIIYDLGEMSREFLALHFSEFARTSANV
jgi:hypothetical protein